MNFKLLLNGRRIRVLAKRLCKYDGNTSVYGSNYDFQELQAQLPAPANHPLVAYVVYECPSLSCASLLSAKLLCATYRCWS